MDYSSRSFNVLFLQSSVQILLVIPLQINSIYWSLILESFHRRFIKFPYVELNKKCSMEKSTSEGLSLLLHIRFIQQNFNFIDGIFFNNHVGKVFFLIICSIDFSCFKSVGDGFNSLDISLFNSRDNYFEVAFYLSRKCVVNFFRV